jgi:hypothetical protein
LEYHLNAFLKTLGLVTLALFAASALLSVFWPSLRLFAGWAGFALMGLNAFAAIALLRLRRYIEPLRLILTSMLVRLLLVVAVMLAVIQTVSHGPALYSFIFSAMAGFVVYQAVEIRHILRTPELLALQ